MISDLPLIGQSARLDDLIKSCKAGRFANGFLISGPPGTGKRTLSQYLSQIILCEHTAACGSCSSCMRVREGNHPDLLRITAHKRSIGVDEARALVASLGEAPFEGGRRAVIIEDADKLTIQAQNALLKTLEEHTASTVFLLLSTKPDDLLLTVRSRLSPVRMALLSDADMAHALRGHIADDVKMRGAIRFADGSVGRALAFLSDERAASISALAQEILLSARDKALTPGALMRLREAKEDTDALMDAFEGLLSEALRSYALGDPPALAQAFTYEQINAMMGACVQARRWLRSNVTPLSAAEGILRAAWHCGA